MRELLEKYKNGTLTVPDEQDAFMHELLQIKAQRMQNQAENMQNSVKKKGIIRQLNTFLQSVEIKKYFAVAACMLLGCVTIWKYAQGIDQLGKENRTEIASLSNNLIESCSNSITRGNSTSEENIDSSIKDLYEKEEFEKIIKNFEGKTSISDEEKLFLASTYLKLKKIDYSKAIDCYNTIKTADYKQNIAMIVARCHIELGYKDVARLELEHIRDDPNQGNEYIETAKELLEKLDKK